MLSCAEKSWIFIVKIGNTHKFECILAARGAPRHVSYTVMGTLSMEGALAMVRFILIIRVGHITSFKSYIIRKQVMY